MRREPYTAKSMNGDCSQHLLITLWERLTLQTVKELGIRSLALELSPVLHVDNEQHTVAGTGPRVGADRERKQPDEE